MQYHPNIKFSHCFETYSVDDFFHDALPCWEEKIHVVLKAGQMLYLGSKFSLTDDTVLTNMSGTLSLALLVSDGSFCHYKNSILWSHHQVRLQYMPPGLTVWHPHSHTTVWGYVEIPTCQEHNMYNPNSGEHLDALTVGLWVHLDPCFVDLWGFYCCLERSSNQQSPIEGH